MGVVSGAIAGVRIFFVHLLHLKGDLVSDLLALAEASFDCFVLLNLCVLRVDEGSALLTGHGIALQVFSERVDCIDWLIAANDGQHLIESGSAFARFNEKFIYPLLFVLRTPVDVFVEKALCC